MMIVAPLALSEYLEFNTWFIHNMQDGFEMGLLEENNIPVKLLQVCYYFTPFKDSIDNPETLAITLRYRKGPFRNA